MPMYECAAGITEDGYMLVYGIDRSSGQYLEGTPELLIIGAVALLVLGPDQVKKLAKDVGKVSAELKQVPDEFNKGMADGAQELESKKLASPPAAEAPPAPPAPPPAE